MRKISIDIAGLLRLNVSNLPCPVSILEGSGNSVQVEIHGDENLAKEVLLEQDGDKVKLFGSPKLNSGTNISGVVISGGNVSISNISSSITIGGSTRYSSSKVVVDGVDVSDYVASKKGTKSEAQLEKIVVYIPKNSQLKLSSLQKAVIAVDLSSLNVKFGGNSEFDLQNAVADADIDLKGQAQGVIYSFKNGTLKADTSGQASLRVRGSFTKVKLDMSGQSSVSTEGIVTGDYSVDASGQSSGSHAGVIQGDFEKDCSGQSSFRRK